MQIVLLIYLVVSAIATYLVIAASIISSRISQHEAAIRKKSKYTRPTLRTIKFPQWWSKFESPHLPGGHGRAYLRPSHPHSWHW